MRESNETTDRTLGTWSTVRTRDSARHIRNFEHAEHVFQRMNDRRENVVSATIALREGSVTAKIDGIQWRGRWLGNINPESVGVKDFDKRNFLGLILEDDSWHEQGGRRNEKNLLANIRIAKNDE